LSGFESIGHRNISIIILAFLYGFETQGKDDEETDKEASDGTT
jgi:hypothetical protein